MYRTLRPTGQIRLVTIDTNGIPDSQVSCRIEEADLTDGYVAVSYAWGDNALTRTILLNGTQFPVTHNCELLLRALRQQESKPDAKRWTPFFWIDALCIDQRNVLERNSQVAQMGDVYSRAQKTVVYLGEHDEHSAMVLPFWDAWDNGTWKGTLPLRVIGDIGGCKEHTLNYGGGSCRHEAHLETFSNRAWFHRTWVVQEVMLASYCEFLVSSAPNTRFSPCTNIFPSRHLASAWFRGKGPLSYLTREHNLWTRRSFEDLVSRVRAAGDPPAILGLLYAFSGPEQQQYRAKGRLNVPLWVLNAVMDFTRGFGCSDPRDRIFAFLSLFPSPLPVLLRPDYNKTVCETYTDAMWFMIDYGDTEVIMAAGSTRTQSSLSCPPQTHSDLPSWVVDFSSPRYTSRVARPEWQAGFSFGQKRTIATRYGQTLTFRGVRIAMVQSLSADHLLDEPSREPQSLDKSPVRSNIRDTLAQGIRRLRSKKPARRESPVIRHSPIPGLLTTMTLDDTLDTLRVFLPEFFDTDSDSTNIWDNYLIEFAFSALSTNLEVRTMALEMIQEFCHITPIPIAMFEERCKNRCIVHLENGRSAIAPLGTQVGDFVFVFLGVETPMVVRQLDGSSWQLVGQCFVASLMRGQAVDEVNWEKIDAPVPEAPLEDFRIR